MTIFLYKVVRESQRRFHGALIAINAFHVRYRWAFLLIVVVLIATVVWGFGEVGKALFGLGLEQTLMKLGEWSRENPEAMAEAEKVAESV